MLLSDQESSSLPSHYMSIPPPRPSADNEGHHDNLAERGETSEQRKEKKEGVRPQLPMMGGRCLAHCISLPVPVPRRHDGLTEGGNTAAAGSRRLVIGHGHGHSHVDTCLVPVVWCLRGPMTSNSTLSRLSRRMARPLPRHNSTGGRDSAGKPFLKHFPDRSQPITVQVEKRKMDCLLSSETNNVAGNVE